MHSPDLLTYRQCAPPMPPEPVQSHLCRSSTLSPSRYGARERLYNESLHLIGAYPYSRWPNSPKLLPEDIGRLIAEKSQATEAKVLQVERELLLLTTSSKLGEEPYRCDVRSQFDTWFVVQLFRIPCRMCCGSMTNRGLLSSAEVFLKDQSGR